MESDGYALAAELVEKDQFRLIGTMWLQKPKARSTPWGSSYREAPEHLHGGNPAACPLLLMSALPSDMFAFLCSLVSMMQVTGEYQGYRRGDSGL